MNEPVSNTYKPKLHVAHYFVNNKEYRITLEGCHEEICMHAFRLGLTVDGVLNEQSEIED